MDFKSALEEYKIRPSAMNEPVRIERDRIPTKSELYKCVGHITSMDFSAHNSVDVLRERKSLVAKQLLQELAHWKAQILSLPDIRDAEFVDKISVVSGSTEIRGEAMVVIKTINGLVIDPHLEYIEIAHAPNIAWHGGGGQYVE